MEEKYFFNKIQWHHLQIHPSHQPSKCVVPNQDNFIDETHSPIAHYEREIELTV